MPGSLNTVQPSVYGDIYNITAAKSDVVLAAAAAAGRRVTRVYGYNSATTSDHRFRQAIDFMHYGDFAMRDWLVSYLIKNAGALGIMGIISNRRCMGFPENERNPADCEVTWLGPSGVWRTYRGSDPHTDHVHVQFNTNAIEAVKGTTAKTKPWTGTLYLIKDTKAYDGNGHYHKTYKAGTKFVGTVDKSDYSRRVKSQGRYFRVFRIPHRLWLPLDDHNFSHTKNGRAL